MIGLTKLPPHQVCARKYPAMPARLLGADRINLADVQDGGADAAVGFAWLQAAV